MSNHCKGCVHFNSSPKGEMCEMFANDEFLDNKYLGECIYYHTGEYDYDMYEDERVNIPEWVDFEY